jgi:hypothetical protein
VRPSRDDAQGGIGIGFLPAPIHVGTVVDDRIEFASNEKSRWEPGRGEGAKPQLDPSQPLRWYSMEQPVSSSATGGPGFNLTTLMGQGSRSRPF